MHKADFTELVSKLRLLNPQQLAQLGTEMTDSQHRVEAVKHGLRRDGAEICPTLAPLLYSARIWTMYPNKNGDAT